MNVQVGQQYDPEAERAVISAIFTQEDAIMEFMEILEPDDFYEEAHKIIYATAIGFMEAGQNPDILLIANKLAQEGVLHSIGGIGYLHQLLDSKLISQFSTDPAAYAQIVYEFSSRRQMLNLGELVNQVSPIEGGVSASDALITIEESVRRLTDNDKTTSKPVKADSLLDQVKDRVKELSEDPDASVPGVPTGFPELDEMTGGWGKGQLIVVAARPAVGKSALAMDFVRAGGIHAGKSVMFFSLEMGLQELMFRLLSSETKVELAKIKRGRLTQEEWMQLNEADERIRNSNIFFDETSKNVTVSHIRSRAIRQKYSPEGLDLIVIDYLQLMEVANTNKNYGRQEQVAEMSRGLKLLTKELDVPIIMLAQINRNSESRADKKPHLADLRESGAIEQDVDIAILIDRPEQSDPNIRPGEADLIVAKQRGGPTGTVPVNPMLEFGMFAPGEGIIPIDEERYSQYPEDMHPANSPEPYYPPPTVEDQHDWQ